MYFRTFTLYFLLIPFLLSGQDKLTLEALPEAINSPLYDEIAPVVSHDGQTIYFTRVGHPDFNKTLEVEGKNIELTLSSDVFISVSSWNIVLQTFTIFTTSFS